MWITMNAISERQRACFYIYQKQKKCETFLYTKSHTLCKNQDNLRYIYIYKSKALYVTQSSWKLWDWHLYTKRMTLCITWSFYVQKSRHFAKSKTVCITFLYTVWLKWIAKLCSRYAPPPPLWEQFSLSLIFRQFSHWNVLIWQAIKK